MKFSLVSSLAALAATAQAADLPSIEIVGNKFFYSNNGSQFYIRGVAYQSNAVANDTSGANSFTDPLANGGSCKRDIPYLQKLSTNVVRVYAINTTQDHSECMNALNEAGIYVISDLSEPGLSIIRDDPKWNIDLLNRYTSVVDALANYSNVLGFFAGNEVTNAKNNTDASPFVKAAIRDVKAYMKQKNYRNIPVGYSASDDAQVRVPEANYFACGDRSESADFYGVNMYEWCGDSTFQKSGYEARTEEMKNMTIPLFFSEYGCNEVQPRKFQEVGTLFSKNMTDVWSGGIVYMYFQEQNDYGLVSVSGNSVSTLSDFNYLSSAMQSVSPTSAASSDITTSTSVIACPTNQANWHANTKLPPTPDAGVCKCVSDSSSCVIDGGVDSDDYGKLFGYLCGKVSCKAINGNGTSGVYGGFSGCSPKDQLNFVLNEYYQDQDQNSQACSFQGSASLVQNANTASSCSNVFKAVGTAGTGSVSAGSSINVGTSKVGAKATGSAAKAGSGSGSGSGSSSDSSSGSKSGSKSGSSSASSSKSSSSKSKNAAPVATGNMKYAAGVLGGAVAVVAGVL